MQYPQKAVLLTAMVSLGLLTSCASIPSKPTMTTEQKQLSETPLAQAQALEQQGNYIQASDLYDRTARMLPFPRSEVWRAKAAEMAWKSGQLNRAETLIKETDVQALGRTDKAHVSILAARIARQKREYKGVISTLNFPRQSLPRDVQRQILALLYQAYNRTGDRKGLAQVLIERLNIARSLNDSDQLWQVLSDFTPQELMAWKSQPIPPVTRGWIALAHIAKTTGYNAETLESSLLRWEQSYRNHPAKPDRVQAIRAQRTNLAINTQQVGVLLPMSGPYAEISRVVLDGLMAAQFTNPGNTTNIQVYDTGNDPASIHARYRQAIQEGANLVIGPMNKDSVDQLAAASLDVPVIALNYGKNTALFNPNLFQFALLPEDEAAQAAQRMIRDGLNRAVVFVPDNSWGLRISTAFTQTYESFGGSISAVGKYDSNKTDNSPVIRKALGVNKDKRREDVDAIFMAASPKEARLLKPLFRFHRSGDLPVYATSHIFSGQTNSSTDADLNGTRYTEIPWLINDIPSVGPKPPTQGELSDNAQQIPRLFAFGYDSYSLAPKVRQLASSPLLKHEGLSGDIYADDTNRLHRTMGWAEFKRGKPKPLPEAVEY